MRMQKRPSEIIKSLGKIYTVKHFVVEKVSRSTYSNEMNIFQLIPGHLTTRTITVSVKQPTYLALASEWSQNG